MRAISCSTVPPSAMKSDTSPFGSNSSKCKSLIVAAPAICATAAFFPACPRPASSLSARITSRRSFRSDRCRRASHHRRRRSMPGRPANSRPLRLSTSFSPSGHRDVRLPQRLDIEGIDRICHVRNGNVIIGLLWLPSDRDAVAEDAIPIPKATIAQFDLYALTRQPHRRDDAILRLASARTSSPHRCISHISLAAPTPLWLLLLRSIRRGLPTFLKNGTQSLSADFTVTAALVDAANISNPGRSGRCRRRLYQSLSKHWYGN